MKAKVLIPKSIPMLWFLAGTISGITSATKLRKYRLVQSLITVTELGGAGSSLDQIGLIFPILAR